MISSIHRRLLLLLIAKWLATPGLADNDEAQIDVQGNFERHERLLEKHGATRLKQDALVRILRRPNTTSDDYFAAFLIYPHLPWLEEALRKKPGSTVYLIRASTQGTRNVEDRLASAQQLVKLQPENKAAYFILASIFAELGKTEEAIEIIRKSKLVAAYHTHKRKSRIILEKFLVANGSSELGAKMMSSYEVLNPMMMPTLQLRKAFLAKESHLEANDLKVAREGIFRLGSDISTQSKPLSYVDKLIGYALIIDCMKSMNDNVISPDGKTKVGVLRTKYENLRNAILKDSQRYNKQNYDSLTADTLNRYLDLFNSEGESAANDWFDKNHPQK
ncbi:MAG: hypothetical protein AAGH40_14815 [Verrucomicrobiota bacterium]